MKSPTAMLRMVELPTLITNVGDKFSSEIAKILSEIDSIKSNVLPTFVVPKVRG